MTTRACCLGCGSPSALHVCSGCRVARYCNRSCQVKGWLESHAVACDHFRTFFGVKGNGVNSLDEADAFQLFQVTLTKLGYRTGGPLFTTAASLCDRIIKIVIECFPDFDVDSFDTPEWHKSVRDDFDDHANDSQDRQWLQIWRNLPREVSQRFITGGADVLTKAPSRGRGTGKKHVPSRNQIDRSLLADLPPEVQFMLISDLPAYSVFAVLGNLHEEVQIKAILHLMERDVFGSLDDGFEPLIEKYAALRHPKKITPTFREVQTFYNEVAAEVALAISRELSPFYFGRRLVNPLRECTEIVIVGRDMRLVLSYSLFAWYPPMVSQDDVLYPILSDFSMPGGQLESQFHLLVKALAMKVDLSLHLEMKCTKHTTGGKTLTWPTFRWPAANGKTLVEEMDMMIIGPNTGYRLVAELQRPVAERQGTSDLPASSLNERALPPYWN